MLLAYEELSELTALSHQLIAAGKKLLIDRGLIRTHPEGQGRRLRYFLENYDGSLAQYRLPHRRLLPRLGDSSPADLRSFSTRHVGDLHALKVYACLCALGQPGKNRISFRLDRLSSLTKIANEKTLGALDKLATHGLALPRTHSSVASSEAKEVEIVGFSPLRPVGLREPHQN
ncbi:hypothetical protein [Methylobacterium durans]|uniref:hypothetical protein n=1 Tax=Methylobacterium durans TaxID=2202825 RepID=UPI0013A5A30C|nr:hypothetical protein [Methylobacterium durans]